MAKKLLPRSGTTVFIDGAPFTDQVTSFVVRSDTEMTRSETFSTEGKRDQEPGGEGLQIDVTGFLAYDDADAFTPIPAPQNTEYVFRFLDTLSLCELSVVADCPAASMGAVVGQLRFFTMTLLTKADQWAVVWDKTP